MPSKFKPPTPPFIPARYKGGSQKPKAVVLHGTVSSDNPGTARNIALWWNGPTSPVTSCHYVVDPREIIQAVGDHTIAYHCGFNTGSIGVEFCDEQTGPASRWEDADSTAILKRAATLVAQLCLAYDIEPVRPSVADLRRKGPHGIYGHNDSRLAFGHTTHSDPRDFPWGKFMVMVRAEVKRLRGEPTKPPKKVKTFKLLHAPLHGASASDAEIRRAFTRPGVVGVSFSEAYKHGPVISGQPGWRTNIGSASTRRDARKRLVKRDVIVAVRRYRKHLQDGIIKASEAAEPLKIAPERYLVWSVDNVKGRPLALLALHPHAAVKDAWGSKRAQEYRNSMVALEVQVERLRREYGDKLGVVVQGDLNYPDVADGRKFTPRATFERLGLDTFTEGIDWVAWSDNLRAVKHVTFQAGQDHPWIETEFAWR